MNGFRNKNYIPIIVIVCFAGVIILGWKLLFPKIQQFTELRNRIEEKRTEIKNNEEYYSVLAEIETEFKKYEAELSKIDSALPDNAFLPPVFNYLQRVSAQSGMVLKDLGSFNVASKEKGPNVKEITLGLGVSGPYDSFKSFLSTLEKSARLIEVESVSFSSPDKQSTTTGGAGKAKEEYIFNFNLSLKVHSY